MVYFTSPVFFLIFFSYVSVFEAKKAQKLQTLLLTCFSKKRKNLLPTIHEPTTLSSPHCHPSPPLRSPPPSPPPPPPPLPSLQHWFASKIIKVTFKWYDIDSMPASESDFFLGGGRGDKIPPFVHISRYISRQSYWWRAACLSVSLFFLGGEQIPPFIEVFVMNL
jgi:hypothetical protein